jgi:hypothetical protein
MTKNQITKSQSKLRVPFNQKKEQVSNYGIWKTEFYLYNIPFETQLELVRTHKINSGLGFEWKSSNGFIFHSSDQMFLKVYKGMVGGRIKGKFCFYKKGSSIFLDVYKPKPSPIEVSPIEVSTGGEKIVIDWDNLPF